MKCLLRSKARGKCPLSFRVCLAGAGCADHLGLHLLGLVTHPELAQRPLVPVQLPHHEAVERLLHLLQAPVGTHRLPGLVSQQLVVVPHPPLELGHLVSLAPEVRPLDGHLLAHVQEADQVRPGQTNIRLLAPVYAQARLK